MPKCLLTDKQKAMIRSLAPGLRDGTVETSWAWAYGGGEIRGIRGLPSELRMGAWKDVKRSDFEAFFNCGFLTRQGILNEALILDAVDRDFQDDTSVQRTQINISGGDFRNAIVNNASTLTDVQQSIEITIRLPEVLVREATVLGILSSEHIETLLRADIQAQLAAMAADPDIQREIAQIEREFSITESDGLNET